ncbi:unnamed protein product [Withania somnifera]
MVLDERIQIPHYAVGWGESCSAKLGVQCSYGGSILERELKGPSKERGKILPSSTHYRWMLQPLSLWLQDGNEGRGGREERVIRYWLTLISGLATERVYGTTKLCDYAILGDGDRRREGDGHNA